MKVEKMKVNKFISCIFFLFLINNIVIAKELSPQELLKQVYINSSKVSYTAISETKIFKPKLFITKARIYNKLQKNKIEYFSKPLNGTYLIDDGVKLIRFNPYKKIIFISNSEFNNNQEDLNLLLNNFNIKIQGEEEILNRKVYILTISSKYIGRNYKKIWVDKEKYIILKSELYNYNNELISSNVFSMVNFNAQINNDLFIPKFIQRNFKIIETNIDEKYNKTEIEKIIGFDIIEPNYIPAGFKKQGYYLQKRPYKDVGYIQYFDGLNSISIFQIKCIDSDYSDNRGYIGGYNKHKRRYGRKHCFGRFNNENQIVINTNKGKIRIIVVSDISEEEIEKIISSFVF